MKVGSRVRRASRHYEDSVRQLGVVRWEGSDGFDRRALVQWEVALEARGPLSIELTSLLKVATPDDIAASERYWRPIGATERRSGGA